MNPLAELLADREAARASDDPCANLCTFATVDAAGTPQARTLVLRDVAGRLAVFANTSSPKWSELGRTPVAVVVWLPTLNRQYRLRCGLEPVPPGLVHESWLMRPAAAQRLDWYYTRQLPQSSPVADRAALLAGLAALDLPEPLTAPDTAAGMFLVPEVIERLDLNQADGVHDRRRFERGNPDWRETTLVP